MIPYLGITAFICWLSMSFGLGSCDLVALSVLGWCVVAVASSLMSFWLWFCLDRPVAARRGVQQ